MRWGGLGHGESRRGGEERPGRSPAATLLGLARPEREDEDDGDGKTDTEPGLDKGNVASRRNRMRPRGERGSPTSDAWRRKRRWPAVN